MIRVALALALVAVSAGAIVLAIEARGSEPDVAVEAAPRVAHVARAPTVSAPIAHAKFVAPKGIAAAPSTTDPSQRFAIPAGGYARWTGREGTWPGDLEAFAAEAGLRLPVALEQRRSTVLEERTHDVTLLGELLGAPPSGEVLAAIARHTSALHEATASAQVQVREGSLSDDAAVAVTRAAEEAYRRGYLEATGLDDARFDRFFAPDRPFR